MCFTVYSKQVVYSPVILLLTSSNPSAVFWRVPKRVIDSINCAGSARCVFVISSFVCPFFKCQKTVFPLIADCYPTTTVSFIMIISFAGATLVNVLPYTVESCATLTVHFIISPSF